MFNYTNTVVVNSNLDTLSKLPRWTTEEGFMEVKRVMKFEKDNVQAIYKRAGRHGKLAEVTLLMKDNGAELSAGSYRLKLYIKLSGSQNSYYSNDFVFKGKPFYVEFEVKTGDTAAVVAKRIAKLAKHLQQMYDNKYMEYTAVGDNLVITGIDEFQRFTQADLQKFNPTLGVNSVGKFETLHSAKVEESDEHETGYTIVQGVEAFGDYFHILKDLRLPTVENTSWTSINAEEMPVPGALYNQYTIHYKKNRGQVGGGACVGQDVTSITTNVFYVQQAFAASFEAALAKVGTIHEVVNNGSFDNDGGVTTNTLALSKSNIDLVQEGTEQSITATTNASTISVKILNDWIKVTVVDMVVKVSAEPNTTNKKSSGRIVITAGDQSQTVTVTQATL